MTGKRWVGLIGAIMALFGAKPILADTRSGIEAYRRGDYATAISELEKSAKAGDAQAYFNLGVAYAEGKAVAQDHAKAAEFYRQGASKGSVLAAFNLAQAYRKAQGVPLDYAQAARWYEFAAKRGDYRAGNELGLLYVEGKGVRRDPVEGFAWVYPATHMDIMDGKAMANAMQLAGMLTRDQIQTAQARGQSYYKRFMLPNRALVRALRGQ
jgi:TPR repeat protein